MKTEIVEPTEEQVIELAKNQERFDPLWVKLTGYFNDRIEELRKANDSIDADEMKTLKIRTEIAVYKNLLKL